MITDPYLTPGETSISFRKRTVYCPDKTVKADSVEACLLSAYGIIPWKEYRLVHIVRELHLGVGWSPALILEHLPEWLREFLSKALPCT